jgi:tRNA nucleotidyltransferase (CCA-adding enzyme)
MDKLLADVVKKIKPADKKLLKEVDAFLKKTNALLKKNKIKATATVGGSVAKDTYLSGDHDCDIFVRFDKSYKDSEISDILEGAIKSFKPERVHGSRDYFHVSNGINYEIVPVLDINNAKDAVNVTDMSPLHVAWVKSHPGLNDDIRLAKQFCKACRVYGAESYIKGFSGHVLDILTIHHGGFKKLLAASQKWKDKEVIDPEKHYKKNALSELNRSKTDSPIIVIDPVYPKRNAAAALSYEKLAEFRKAAAEFIKKPSKEHFTIRNNIEEKLRKETGTNRLLAIDVVPLEGKEDVVGAKIMKVFQQIRNQLNFYDFVIVDAGWSWDKKKSAILVFIIDPAELMPIKKWVGPPVSEKERAENFRAKHEKTFIENDRVCAYVKRRYTRPEQLITELFLDPLLRERVKKISLR